ncbi:MAG: methyltransferase domain-containing protein, partial [Calditrichaceae bacterium]
MQESTSYTWDADDYADQSLNQKRWAQELIGKLNLKGNEHVLDLGCGDGKISAEIAKLVPHGTITGMDSSEAMVELASSKFSELKYPNLNFIKGDARSFRISNAYDIVFSNAVLHWVIDHRPVLRNIYECLRAGGTILLQMGGKGNASEILKVLDEIGKEETWQAYFENFDFPYGFYGVAEYKKWLTAAGFVIKRVELIPKVMTHTNKSALEGWIRTTWLPYT